jgi:polar amino acid transport system substrate-binding protein
MRTVLRRRSLIAGTLLVAAMACGTARMPAVPGRPSLRVGVTSGSPPLVFRRQGQLTGLEVEMAYRLADALGRELRFLELPWEEQPTALLDGRTDIIMSGMSVTRARSVRMVFGEPYLASGLAVLMRRADTERYDSLEAVRLSTARVGVVEGTTGEIFVRNELPDSQVALYPNFDAATDELLGGLVDVAVYDIPVVVWMVSKHEGELALLRKRLGDDHLAWAFRPDDAALRTASDVVLAGWKQDGTLAAMLGRWLPYWSEVD